MEISKKQRGFAMLEVVLAIVIIAIASFGIYKLYNTSTLKSKLRTEEETISSLYSAATNFAFNNSRQPGKGELFKTGALPLDIWPSANDTIKGAFGPIGYGSDGKDYIWSAITAHNIPGSVANELCANMQKWADIYIGSNLYGGETAIVFDANKKYNINIYFPKGKYVQQTSE